MKKKNKISGLVMLIIFSAVFISLGIFLAIFIRGQGEFGEGKNSSAAEQGRICVCPQGYHAVNDCSKCVSD